MKLSPVAREISSQAINLRQDAHWFAVHTKPHQEGLAAARLGQLDLEVFLPRLRQEQWVGGVVRWVVKALFPGYLFARFCPALSGEVIRYVPGIVGVVGTRQSPLPVEPEIIANIRERIQGDGFVRLQARPYRPGEKVWIEQGPFAGWMAEVERESDDGRRVAILLGALQQAHMLLPARWLLPVAVA